MNFEQIRRNAVSQWKRLEVLDMPVIRIGTGTSDRASGAMEVIHEFEKELEKYHIRAKIIKTGSVGFCNYEPLVIIKKTHHPHRCYPNVTPQIVPQLVKNFIVNDDSCRDIGLGTFEMDREGYPCIPELPRSKYELRLLLRNCGVIDPENIDHYIALGGYEALNKAFTLKPLDIIEGIKHSGLRGRGGGGFPTWRKLETCFKSNETPKFVICNADEGDPGAFMDRVVLESDPHAVLEGMIICAYILNASQGYIYTRMEYPLAVERLKIAISQAKASGLLGEDILGTGFTFDIDVFQGAGAFICGESSALMYSIEGKRGFPRVRPPQSVEAGLWGKPTHLNNVKTYAYMPAIINKGSEYFSSIGSAGSKGTAVFALAGKVNNVGLVEVPMGTTLENVITDIGAGVTHGNALKAIQIGGPSGGCLPTSFLTTPIDFDSLTEAGAMMGSGGMIVMDQDNCMVDAARFFLDFTVQESCGKCVMCRLGTKQMQHLLEDIVSGHGTPDHMEVLVTLAEDVKAGSLCGLGKSAPNPILTTIQYFQEEYVAHVLHKRCPALVCRDLISFYILHEKCHVGCEDCVRVCPVDAITEHPKKHKVVDQARCVKCGNCLEICPPEYDAVHKCSPKRWT